MVTALAVNYAILQDTLEQNKDEVTDRNKKAYY